MWVQLFFGLVAISQAVPSAASAELKIYADIAEQDERGDKTELEVLWCGRADEAVGNSEVRDHWSKEQSKAVRR